jgi:preprotein translocase subunit SecA
VQLIGGMILHEGKVAEMRTGEGKTLVATLPLYLKHWKAKGSIWSPPTTTWPRSASNGWADLPRLRRQHQRHQSGAGRPTKPLPLRPAIHIGGRPLPISAPHYRREAYQADITYGTNNEFGFDYCATIWCRTWPNARSGSSITRSSTRSTAS